MSETLHTVNDVHNFNPADDDVLISHGLLSQTYPITHCCSNPSFECLTIVIWHLKRRPDNCNAAHRYVLVIGNETGLRLVIRMSLHGTHVDGRLAPSVVTTTDYSHVTWQASVESG